MITPTTIVVLVSLMTVLAMALVIVLLIRMNRKIVDKNAAMAEELLEKGNSSASDVPRVSRIQEALSSMEQPMKMEDDQLIAWFDAKMDSTELFLQPDLDLKTVAEKFGISQRRIIRLMKSQPEYGTLAAYLTEKRLAKACSLLKLHPEYTIEGICKDAGFSSRRTFQTVFKSRMGIIPSEYRTAVLNQEQ